MDTLAIVATKGGVGKTTLAVHLAVAAQHDGQAVLVLDLDDPQHSAVQWGKTRARLAREHGVWYKTALEVRPVDAESLANVLDAARAERFDWVIIDTPPHADFPAARAGEIADIILMPVRPSYLDLHAAKATIALVCELQAQAYFVVNQVPHNNLRIADDAAEFLQSKGVKQAPVSITALQPYVRALRDGLTAPELVPNGRHAQEIGALWAFVKEQARSAPRKPRQADKPTARSLLLDDPWNEVLADIRGDAA